MIIQWILILGLLLCLFYAYLQRGKSRLVSFAIAPRNCRVKKNPASHSAKNTSRRT